MGRSVTGGAGLGGRMFMHAADKRRGFVCMAGDTLYRLGMVGVRVRGDGGMTGAAAESAVHAGVKDVSIDAGKLWPAASLQRDVAVAGEAVRLRMQRQGSRAERRSPARPTAKVFQQRIPIALAESLLPVLSEQQQSRRLRG